MFPIVYATVNIPFASKTLHGDECMNERTRMNILLDAMHRSATKIFNV